jgi:hypothetical protein
MKDFIADVAEPSHRHAIGTRRRTCVWMWHRSCASPVKPALCFKTMHRRCNDIKGTFIVRHRWSRSRVPARKIMSREPSLATTMPLEVNYLTDAVVVHHHLSWPDFHWKSPPHNLPAGLNRTEPLNGDEGHRCQASMYPPNGPLWCSSRHRFGQGRSETDLVRTPETQPSEPPMRTQQITEGPSPPNPYYLNHALSWTW